jgi:ATP-dependent Clp protease ATP-binding subunit ClpC
MFERFTDQARNVMVLAQQEALRQCHQHLGSEHLILGVIREGRGLPSEVLGDLGIELNDMRARVEALTGRGDQRPSGHLPFTPNAQAALARSAQLADVLGDPSIGAEHLLLALAGEPQSCAVRALRASNVDPELVRVVLVAKIADRPSPEPDQIATAVRS